MLRLLRLVTKIISSTPAATASSTIYCNAGLSTIGSISFGMTLLAGKTRVPSPATGNTALRIFMNPPYFVTLAGSGQVVLLEGGIFQQADEQIAVTLAEKQSVIALA